MTTEPREEQGGLGGPPGKRIEIMRAFDLIRFPLTQVAHFGDDKKASEDLLGNHTD